MQKRTPRKIWKTRIYQFFFLLPLTIIHEIFSAQFHLSMSEYILLHLAPSILIKIVSTSLSEKTKAKKLFNRIEKRFKEILQVRTCVGGLALIVVLLTVSAKAASFHPFGQMIHTMISVTKENVAPSSNVPSYNTSPQLGSDTATERNAISDGDDFWDGILVVPDECLILTPDSPLYLEIFFQAGCNNLLTDWTYEEVESYIRTEVATRQQQALDPNYEEMGTPQRVRDEIAHASTSEQYAQTLEELKNVIDIRLWVYSEYPEYRLSSLIRENYCTCGDAYVTRNLSPDTAIYYYAHSIHWGLVALEYDLPSSGVSYNLSILAERYQKIANNAPGTSTLRERAQLLADAFSAVSEEYF